VLNLSREQKTIEQLAEKIIVALDVDNEEDAYMLANRLSPPITFFKIGLKLFVSCGPRVINGLKKIGVRIFLDLKFHDIPNTVASTAKVAVEHGVDMFNIHLSGGREMALRTVETAKNISLKLGVPCPLILGVTVLTSFNQKMLQEMTGSPRELEEHVFYLAHMARETGLDGIIASPLEAAAIRREIGNDFVIVTPGVRPAWAASGDQQRIMTPSRALEKGASYLVIGRPIIEHPSPWEATEKILAEMGRK
jgi:orotidine-5'-phosphate decarboxylase